MNEEKKPTKSEEVESWFIDEEITLEKLDNGGIEVNSVSLHDEETNGITSNSDAAIIGGPVIGENNEPTDLVEVQTMAKKEATIRKSIMEDLKEPVEVKTESKNTIDSDIAALNTPDLVVARAENIDDTVFPDKSITSTTSGSKLANLQSAPEYLQEESVQTTAERRYDFMTQTKVEEVVAEIEPNWNEPQPEQTAVAPSVSSLEETIFEGATVVPSVPSRIAAHLWSLLLTLLLAPLAWYYSLDVAQRLRVGPTSPWQGGPLTAIIITELIGATVCVFLVVFLARFSSLGTFVTGAFLTSIGILTTFTPHLAVNKLEPVLRALEHSSAENTTITQNLMSNIGKMLNLSAGSGLFLFLGIILLALGFVSHGARRKGRKDYLIQRKVNEFK